MITSKVKHLFPKGLLQKVLILLTIFNLFFASWYVLNKDIYFHTDIARDFLLLKEIKEKKVVLIGQRAGIDKLYHGPAWLYINFPVYFLSNGNPIAVGWYWIMLSIVFLFASFYIAKRLFDTEAAYFFVLLLSLYLVPQTREFSHPHGAFLVMPLFFYTFWRYAATLKTNYLVLSVLINGLLIQFEMAIGIPIFLLSTLYIIFLQFKKKKIKHIFLLLLIFIPLSTFFIFDIRHDFIQLNGLKAYIELRSSLTINYWMLLKNRFDYFANIGAPFFTGKINIIASSMFAFLLILLIKQNTQKKLYLTFIYFYFGYFVVTLFNRGSLLIHHVMPIVPLVFLIFTSLSKTKYRQIFLILFFLIVAVKEIESLRFIQSSNSFIGKHEDSWRFLHNLSLQVFNDAQSNFGYFVYSPDAFAYEPKYAMFYTAGQFEDKVASSFSKKHLTYVVATPPPPNEPWIKDEWWTVNKIRITKQPAKAVGFSNGYKFERYELTEEEASIPFDNTADVGINFR